MPKRTAALLPVGDDVGRSTDGARVIQTVINQVLQVGHIDIVTVVIPGIIPVLLKQGASLPLLAQIDAQGWRPCRPFAGPKKQLLHVVLFLERLDHVSLRRLGRIPAARLDEVTDRVGN